VIRVFLEHDENVHALLLKMILLHHRVSSAPHRLTISPQRITTPAREQSDTRSNPLTFAMFQ
jgi:hypothetical protein